MRFARGFAQLAVAPRDATATVVRHPYFIQRNSRGSIPVYTDVRNAGSRYLVLIRNVEGNVNVSTFHHPRFSVLITSRHWQTTSSLRSFPQVPPRLTG